MIEFTRKALEYTRGLDQAAFVANDLIYDAVLRNLELIGEAATRVPDAIRIAHPEVPWRQVIATRNRLVNGHLGIDDDTIWSIIEDDLQPLLDRLTLMLDEPHEAPDA